MLNRHKHKHVCVRSHFSQVWQAPLSMGFSRQEYWSGLPFPPPGDLPDPGIKPRSLMTPAVAGGFFSTSGTWGAPRKTARWVQKLSTYSCPPKFPWSVAGREKKENPKTYLISRSRKWQPTPVSLPENPMDQEPGGVQSISVQSLRRVWVLWPHGLQHTRPPCPSPTPWAYSNSGTLSRWFHPAISSCHPLLLPPSMFPNISMSSSHQVAKVLEFQLQHQSFQWIFRTDFL